MNREEFEQYYARNSNITVARIRELRKISLPCNCGEENCTGWQMRGLDTFVDEYDFEGIPEPYLSEIKVLLLAS